MCFPSSLSRCFQGAMFSGVWMLARACMAANSNFVTDLMIPIELPTQDTCNFLNDQKTRLSDEGVSLYFQYWGDFLANPVGGNSRSATWTQLMIFGGELDLQKLIGWQGGYLDISAADVAGRNLSQNIGNFFTVSQAYVSPTFSMYNLYLRQTFLDDKIELRIGRMSSGQEFAALPAFGALVSGGLNGNPTSLFVNAPFTSTPNATWMAWAKYATTSDTSVQTGIFQATKRLGNPNYNGMDFSIRPNDGILMMGEFDWTPAFGATESKTDGKTTIPANPGLTGTYQIGGYYSNYTFDNFLGGVQHNVYGLYAQGQQMLWHARSDPNISFSLWGGVTYSPQYQCEIMPVMGYTGAVWQGVIPGRDQDQLLFAYMIGGFSSDYSASETAAGASRATAESSLEWSYVVQINTNLQFQPDVQYIIQPDGTTTTPNALVIGFQVSAIF